MRLLITTSRLDSYGGSEIVVLELVEWFISRGWHVTLLCGAVRDLILNELSGFVYQRTLRLSQLGTENVNINDFDLIWITHNTWPENFQSISVQDCSSIKIVSLHLGSLESRETEVQPEIENVFADRILVVSGRTKERMIELGLDAGLMTSFDNPAPYSYCRLERNEQSDMNSVLFVSNHLPQELVYASHNLASNGTSVTHLGMGGTRRERIHPELLLNFDAVVTIGKTTQYCLVMGIPVYSYDHYGGAGWLSSDNFTFEAFNNFSGYRTQRKLSATQLTSEIRGGYEKASSWSQRNMAKFAHHYSLDRQMKELISSLELT